MMIAAWGAFRELNSEGVKPSSSGGVSGICPGGHALAHTMMSTSRIDGVSQSAGVERSSQSSTEPAREFDDGFDFPPTAHPGRAVHILFLRSTDHGLCDLGWLEVDFVDIRVIAATSPPIYGDPQQRYVFVD